MATVKIILYDYYKKEGENKVPVYIRITHRRKPKYISLGIKVDPKKDWDESRLRVKKSYPNYARVNNFIAIKVAEAEKYALDLETNTIAPSPFRIKESITEKKTGQECFIKFANARVKQFEQTGKVRTAAKYKAIINKLERYLKGRTFNFEHFDVAFLYDYENHLKSIGNGTNTIHNNLKSLRAILYIAIQENKFPQEKNPFFRFKLKSAPGKKDRLTVEEIDKIAEIELKADTNLFHSRNAFLFSFYCAGIRIGDLLQLKWKNVEDGLNYQMGKTKKFRRLKLVRQAQAILKLYRNPSTQLEHYIFPFLDNETDYSNPKYLMNQVSSKTTIINKNLKELAKKTKITKNISSHIARHSFADVARKKGIELYDISKALGHSSLSITEHYLAAFDDTTLDNAMDKIFND